MARDRVYIADFINDSLDVERRILGDLADVHALNAFNEEELIGVIDDASAVMMFHNLSMTSRSIERLTQCQLIVRCGVGIDNVDYRFARERGITVANVPDYGTEEVADTAIGMMLMLTRGIHRLNHRTSRQTLPWMYHIASPLYRLRGRVFGIVGLGRIGMATAVRAKAIGMDVRFFDPYLPDGYDKAIGIRRVESLEALLIDTHVLSLHCPLTEETRHMINEKTLRQMPKSGYLVNTARGDVIDLEIIPSALTSGQLAGAAIDVIPHEPPEETHPLLVAWRDPSHAAYERLIINPHAAFYCEEGLLDMRAKGAEACRRALLGEPIRNVVN
jgi:D-3-phosphoglycerate dehydrogenase/C-terminal binding protein